MEVICLEGTATTKTSKNDSKDKTVTAEWLHSLAKAQLFRKPSASLTVNPKQSLIHSNVRQADLLTPDAGLLMASLGLWDLGPFSVSGSRLGRPSLVKQVVRTRSNLS